MNKTVPSRSRQAVVAVALVIGRRLTSAAVTLLAVSVLVFIAIHHIPGSYEDLVLGPFQNEAARERLNDRYALDRPLLQQYFAWLGNVVRGDFGQSLVTETPVRSELGRRIWPTAQLAAMGTTMSIAIGVPMGLAAALWDHRPKLRGAARIGGAAGLSVPDFVVGTALVYLFSSWDLYFKVGSYVPFFEDPIGNLRSTALPAVSLGIFGVALVMRTMRDSAMRTLSEAHIASAVARGTPRSTIVRRHVLRNSAAPVVTVTATIVGVLLGGAVIVEDLFSIPGVGTYVVSAIGRRDYAVIQATVMLSAAVFVTASMLSDLAHAALDPRITKEAL